MSLILMLVVFGLIFYFMILRPQQKRTKEHKKLMDSIAKGDEVLTNGGLVGRVNTAVPFGKSWDYSAFMVPFGRTAATKSRLITTSVVSFRAIAM